MYFFTALTTASLAVANFLRYIEIELYFKYAVDSFSDGIFIRISVLGHSNGNEVVSELGNVIRTTILEPSVRMVDEVLAGGHSSFTNGHFQGV